MNEIRVCSPYLPENVSGGAPAANERVKKVVGFKSFFFSFIIKGYFLA
jgi:protein LSM12